MSCGGAPRPPGRAPYLKYSPATSLLTCPPPLKVMSQSLRSFEYATDSLPIDGLGAGLVQFGLSTTTGYSVLGSGDPASVHIGIPFSAGCGSSGSRRTSVKYRVWPPA